MMWQEVDELIQKFREVTNHSQEIKKLLFECILSIKQEDAEKHPGLFIELCDGVHDWEEFDFRLEQIRDTIQELRGSFEE